MKKIMLSLATVVLITNSTLVITSYEKQTQHQATPTAYVVDATEDAEDIASKLWDQTIKIDPNTFLNKDIQNVQKQFNTSIVKQGILTQTEVQYVSWGHLNINVAGWYWNKGAFTVTKDGAIANGHVTVNASTSETTVQIATKITKATNIKLNYNYWNNKVVQNNLPILRNILVNDNILTKAEASVITAANATTITKAGQITLNLTVNDYKTSSNASLNADVVNDGDSASQIANS